VNHQDPVTPHNPPGGEAFDGPHRQESSAAE
jgi:hypothetical protein